MRISGNIEGGMSFEKYVRYDRKDLAFMEKFHGGYCFEDCMEDYMEDCLQDWMKDWIEDYMGN